jgi:anti-anti-sigma factor
MPAKGIISAKASVRYSGKVAIFGLSGRIAVADGSGVIRNTIRDLVNAGHKNILLNLQEFKHIESSGLGEMVDAYATVSNMGGKIKLPNVHSKVSDLLRATEIYSVFVTFAEAARRLFCGILPQ